MSFELFFEAVKTLFAVLGLISLCYFFKGGFIDVILEKSPNSEETAKKRKLQSNDDFDFIHENRQFFRKINRLMVIPLPLQQPIKNNN